MKKCEWVGSVDNQSLGPAARRTHGMSGTSTYRSWVSMVQRCTNPNNGRYSSYGGRGITVCDRWLSFLNFDEDMGERPEGKSIDRYPDVNGNYEPSNCRWATPKEQGCNRRNNRLIEFGGKTATLSQWAEQIGIPRETLLSRLDRGWDLKRALNLDPRLSRTKITAHTRPESSDTAKTARSSIEEQQ